MKCMKSHMYALKAKDLMNYRSSRLTMQRKQLPKETLKKRSDLRLKFFRFSSGNCIIRSTDTYNDLSLVY